MNEVGVRIKKNINCIKLIYIENDTQEHVLWWMALISRVKKKKNSKLLHIYEQSIHIRWASHLYLYDFLLLLLFDVCHNNNKKNYKWSEMKFKAINRMFSIYEGSLHICVHHTDDSEWVSEKERKRAI